MNKHIALAGGAAIVLLAACGDPGGDTNRAAPAATSSDATSGVAGANPASTAPTGVAQTPAQQTDKGGKPGASTPPPR